jgi:hypothetical protein
LVGAAGAGLLAADQAVPLAHVLYGAIHQAGVSVATAADPAAQRAAMSRAVTDLVTSRLRSPAAAPE